MLEEDLKKAEYDALYKEIQENSAKVYQVLNISVLSTAALLSYSFSNTTRLPFGQHVLPFLLLLPYLVIIPSLRLVRASLHSTVRIASYLKIYYEGVNSLIAWQTSMQLYRKKYDSSTTRPFRFGLAWVFVALCISTSSTSIITFISMWGDKVNHKNEFVVLYCLLALFTLIFAVLEISKVKNKLRREAFTAEEEKWVHLRSGSEKQ